MPRLLLVAALVVGALVAACGDDDARSVTIYSGRSEELVGPILERFTEETGIEVAVRYGDTAELAALLLEEGDRSPADLFFAQDAGALGAVEADGLFATIDDAQLSRAEATLQSPSGAWVGVSGRARVVVYNTERVSPEDLPASILEFTDPEWDGRIAIAADERLVPGLRHRAAPRRGRGGRACVARGHPGQQPDRLREEHAHRRRGRGR